MKMHQFTRPGLSPRQFHAPRLSVKMAAKTVGALALALGLLSAPAAHAKVTLVFGAYTSEKPLTMVRQLRPSLNAIAKSMSTILGEVVEIKMEVTKSYVEGIALLTSGRADFMRLGPASYATASEYHPGLRLLAVENKHGKKEHSGVICVREDSAINDVSQLRGRSVAFGNSRSTLGRYFAQQLLMDYGLYARDLARYEYLGRHDSVARAVGAGQYDAGALSKSTFKKLVEKGVPIRALTTYTSITRSWVARDGIDTRTYDALRTALLGIKDPKALAALRIDGFLETADSDFQRVRDAIKSNPQFFTTKSTASRNDQ